MEKIAPQIMGTLLWRYLWHLVIVLILSLIPSAGDLMAQVGPPQSPFPAQPGADRSRTYAFSPQTAEGYAFQIGGGLGSFSVASSSINLQGSIGGQYHLSSWLSIGGFAGGTIGGYETRDALAGLRSAIGADTSQDGTDQTVLGYYLMLGPRFSTHIDQTSWHFSPLIGVSGLTRFGFKLDDAGARKPLAVKQQHQYEPNFSANPALTFGLSAGFDRPLSGKWRWGLELRYLLISGVRYRSQFIESFSAIKPSGPSLPDVDFGNAFNVSMVQLGLNFTFLDRQANP